jgi:hypothetical protein
VLAAEGEVSHTPGPWVVEDSRKFKAKKLRSEMLMVVAAEGGMPGLIVNSGTVTKTDEANANLIAAAPDLLKSLEGCVKLMTATHFAGVTIETARAAIKKARGE